MCVCVCICKSYYLENNILEHLQSKNTFNEFHFWQNSSEMIRHYLQIFTGISYAFESVICKLSWTLFLCLWFKYKVLSVWTCKGKLCLIFIFLQVGVCG